MSDGMEFGRTDFEAGKGGDRNWPEESVIVKRERERSREAIKTQEQEGECNKLPWRRRGKRMPRLFFLPPIASVGTEKGEKGEKGEAPIFLPRRCELTRSRDFWAGLPALGASPPPLRLCKCCTERRPRGGAP